MSSAIDAEVVLALATKASQVFTEAETMLSFPLTPVVYRRQALREMLAAETAEGLGLLAEFSRLVNRIPTGPVWPLTEERCLWDVYTDVLEDADLANAVRNSQEEAELKRASALLHVKGRDGVPVDSPAAVAYRELRDEWIVAHQEYVNRKGTAEASADREVKARWAADEPLLLAQVQDCERRWAVEGRRAEIEEAQRVERQLTERSPAGMWAGLRKLFDPATPEIFFATDPDTGRYVPSSLRPSNALDGTWARMTLERRELTSLARAAPAALRAQFANGYDSEVERITFEYLSVSVQRPWFVPAALASRAWRFTDPARVLSNGAPAPTGECPAYVVALVLARRVTVTRRAPAPGATSRPRRPLDFGFLRLATTVKPAPVVKRPVVPLVRDHRTTRARVRDHRTAAAPVRTIDPALLKRLRLNDFMRKPMVAPVVVAPSPPARPDSQTTPSDDIYVLGFICKKLGKCPDPDPALSW